MKTIFGLRYILLKNNIYRKETFYMKLIPLIVVCIFTGISSFGSNPYKLSLVSGNAIAFAYPVESIFVDGDISDWPKGMIQYPIDNFFGKNPVSKEDLNAYFKVAYNQLKQSLYFAIVVSDDHHITGTTENTERQAQDSYGLYLNIKNKPSGSGVISYHFNNVWKKLITPTVSWDPDVKTASWDNVKIACKRKDSITVYECSIMLKNEIYPGRSIGVDHVINDKDESGEESFVAWGNHKYKDKVSGKLGFVILMKEDEKVGKITGQLKWKNDSVNAFPGKIKISSQTNSELWVQVLVDSSGIYSVILPVGSYKISIIQGHVWMGEEYIKIDKEKSTSLFTAEPGIEVNAPVTLLTTISLPDLIPEKGIMHDFNDKKAKLIDDFINAYRNHFEIPGASLALIKNGQIIYHKTYGMKNTYSMEAVNDNTLFEAGSTTKPVFAFVVCRLAEKRLIDLDKPLYQYLPFEDIVHDERHKLITARHILCHQTGFPNWPDRNEDGKFDLKFTPGTDFGYSGEAYEYLKRVVVHITQKDIGTILEEEVLSPLNLENIYFEKNDYLTKVASHGHFDNLPTNIRLINSPQMAYSMSTEAKAFSSFILALNNRKGLKNETYDEMFKIQTVIPKDEEEKRTGWDENSYYGLGFKLENSPYGLVFGHSGSTRMGFICNFNMFDDLNMGYVIFTNSYGGAMLVLSPLTEFLITGKGK